MAFAQAADGENIHILLPQGANNTLKLLFSSDSLSFFISTHHFSQEASSFLLAPMQSKWQLSNTTVPVVPPFVLQSLRKEKDNCTRLLVLPG